MKKVLLLILMLFSFMGIVEAESLYLKYKTEIGHAQYIDSIHYKDGVIFLDSASEEERKEITHLYTLLEYRQFDGKIIKSKLYEDFEIFNVITDDEYLYGYGRNFQDLDYYFYKIDQNLEIIKTIKIEPSGLVNITLPKSSLKFIMEDNVFGLYIQKINQANQLDPLVVYTDKDLTEVKNEKLVDTNYFPFEKKLHSLAIEMNTNGDNLTRGIPTKDGVLIAYETKADKTCNHETESCSRYAVLSLIDNDGKEIWKSEFKEYGSIYYIGASNNRYIALAENDNSDTDTNGDIFYLDENGKTITTLDNISIYKSLELKNNVLLMNNGTFTSCQIAYPHDEINYCGVANNYHTIYLLNYDVTTKTTAGKGKVTVDKKISIPGEEVTFNAEPEEGYVLDKVIVTDKKGNTIEFTDYKFTMPTADVTIEAEFVLAEKEETKEESKEETKEEEEKPNPNTSDIFISLILILAILAGIITLIEGHKIRNLI